MHHDASYTLQLVVSLLLHCAASVALQSSDQQLQLSWSVCGLFVVRESVGRGSAGATDWNARVHGSTFGASTERGFVSKHQPSLTTIVPLPKSHKYLHEKKNLKRGSNHFGHLVLN